MNYHIPIRLDYYLSCAETWCAIFKTLRLSPTSIMYDLCPGWSPKIELALMKSAYAGTVYCIDSDLKALHLHNSLFQTFSTTFSYHYITHDVLSKKQLPIPKASYIIGNHILDDLILQSVSPKNVTMEDIFTDQNLLSSLWKKVIEHPKHINTVLDIFCMFCSSSIIKNGYCIFAQYLGYQERLHSYVSNYFYRDMMKNVSNRLQQNGFTPRHDYARQGLHNIQNPYFSLKNLYCYQRTNQHH